MVGLEDETRGPLLPPTRTAVLVPTPRRALLALSKAPPRASGWCRTRWRWATLALTLPATRGMPVSAETRRRWLHELGWVWKRAKLVANDDEPRRIDRLARSRWVCEPLKRGAAVLFADELEMHLWPKGGCAWLPHGRQLAVMTPGQHQQHDVAGALELATGPLLRDRRSVRDAHSPAEPSTRLSVVVDHHKIHQATAVGPWLAAPLRLT